MRFRLTFNPAVELSNDTVSYLFKTKAEMKSCADKIANLLLYLQDDLGVMSDYSNYFFKEEWVDGKWEEMEEMEDE